MQKTTDSRIKVETANMTCSACPSLWEALTDTGHDIYVRYRWGYLSVMYGGVMGKEIFGASIGDNFDGFMTYDELVGYTQHLIDWPEFCGDEPGPLYIVDLDTGHTTTIDLKEKDDGNGKNVCNDQT